MTSQQAIEILEKRADVRASFKLSFPDKSIEQALRMAIESLRSEGELLAASEAAATQLDNYQTIDDCGSDAIPRWLAVIAEAKKRLHQEHDTP